MPNRRRRRDRRPRQPDHPEPPRPQVKKADQRRRTEFEARMQRIARTRTVIGFFGFVPLTISLACATIDLGVMCAVPREIYLGIWAAILGTFLGLTIRIWRERRAFQRGATTT